MSGELAAAGDIATGMLIGRAVEPHAGEVAHGHHERGLCLNCGTALTGDFCAACGQAGHVHRTLSSIGHDLLHGVFHLEGKIWRTLPMLVTDPGALTRRYIAGERARFVSPLALFLFSVFLMFAVLHSTGGELEEPIMTGPERTAAIAKLDRKLADERKALAAAEAVPAATRPEGRIASLTMNIGRDEARRATLADGKSEVAFDLTEMKSTGWVNVDRALAKANANPGLAFYKLQSSAYKYSWALIPISVPFVSLLFLWRRQYKLYDHAIFVTYSLSFMMFLVVALSLCLAIDAPGWIFGLLLWAVPPVHMFVQLRGAYSLRKRSALWRTIALLIFAWIALIAFVVLLLVLGLMG